MAGDILGINGKSWGLSRCFQPSQAISRMCWKGDSYYQEGGLSSRADRETAAHGMLLIAVPVYAKCAWALDVLIPVLGYSWHFSDQSVLSHGALRPLIWSTIATNHCCQPLQPSQHRSYTQRSWIRHLYIFLTYSNILRCLAHGTVYQAYRILFSHQWFKLIVGATQPSQVRSLRKSL